MLGCKELTEACKNASSNAIQKKQISTIQINFPQQKKLNLTLGLLVQYKKPVGKKVHLYVPSNWGKLVFFIFGDLQLVPSPQGVHVVSKKGEIHNKIYNSFWCITNLLPMVVAEWRLLGRGMALLTAGFDHVIVSWRKKTKQNTKWSLMKLVSLRQREACLLERTSEYIPYKTLLFSDWDLPLSQEYTCSQ